MRPSLVTRVWKLVKTSGHDGISASDIERHIANPKSINTKMIQDVLESDDEMFEPTGHYCRYRIRLA